MPENQAVQIVLSPLALVGILLGVMLFSYTFALIEVNMRAKKKVGAAEEKMRIAQVGQSAAEAQLQAAQEALQAKIAEKSLLRLWVDEANSSQLELNGLEVDPQHLTPDQRRQLIAVLTQMRPWLESGTSSPLSSVPTHRAVQPAVAPPVVALPAAPAIEEPLPEPLSLARQIDRILQTRLAGTPLATHGIRIRDLLSGGVEFVVDNKTFNGVEEIPDPQVQAAIRAAITEWERKAG